jgi:hypothetical protein
MRAGMQWLLFNKTYFIPGKKHLKVEAIGS